MSANSKPTILIVKTDGTNNVAISEGTYIVKAKAAKEEILRKSDLKNLPVDVIVQRDGQNLVLIYADGTQLVFDNFYASEAVEIQIPADGADTLIIDSTDSGVDITSASEAESGRQLLAVRGDAAALKTMASDDAALNATVQQVFETNSIEADGLALWLGDGVNTYAAPSAGAGATLVSIGGAGLVYLTQLSDESFLYSFLVVAGPLTDPSSQTVKIYDDAGNFIGNAQYNADAGKYTFESDSEITGAIIAVLVDATAGADYVSELDGSHVDLPDSLIAVAAISPGEANVSITLSPLSNIASTKLGLSVDANGAPVIPSSTTIDATTVTASNQEVGKAFGLGDDFDVAKETAVAVVTDTGATNSEANDYGKVLAAVEGAVQEAVSEGTSQEDYLNSLANSITDGTLSDDAKNELGQGAQEVETQNENVDSGTITSGNEELSAAAAAAEAMGKIVAHIEDGAASPGSSLADFTTAGIEIPAGIEVPNGKTLDQFIVETLRAYANSTGSFDKTKIDDPSEIQMVVDALAMGASSTTVSLVNISDDTGVSASDYITSDTSLTVNISLSAALESYQSLEYTIDGANWQTTGLDGSAITGTTHAFTITATSNIAALQVRVTDVIAQPGASSTAQAIVIDTEAPVFTDGASQSININNYTNTSTTVLDVAATDNSAAEDVGITYSLSGDDADKFDITSAGVMTLKVAADYDAQSSYAVTITATDAAGNASVQTVTFNVLDNDLQDPNIPASQSFDVEENVINGSAVGTVSASDNVGVTSYSITAGNTGGVFAIDNAGNITVASGLDFETTATYTLTIEVKDAADNSYSETVTVNVTNSDDAGSIAAITGAATQGQTLTAGAITDLDDGVTGITYQWQADGTDISGATSSAYTLTQAEVGAVITVIASYTDNEGSGKSVTFTGTSAVADVDDAGSIGAITGTAEEGQILTAGSVTDPDGGVTGITYQWQADGTDISGATSSTYALTSANIGQEITVIATYTDNEGSGKSVTSAATAPVGDVDAPGSIATTTGTATQGQTLTAGAVSDPDGGVTGITYQWQAGGTDISGATGSTYTLTQAEVGEVITVIASYTDNQGGGKSVTSTATSAVADVDDAGSIAATTGSATQGQTLTAGAVSDPDGGVTGVTYQWQAGGTDISGATGSTYTLTQAEVGEVITVIATYTDNEGSGKSVTSTATSAVADVDDAGSIAAITGTTEQGQILTAGAVSDPDGGVTGVTYQWQADGTDISGATSSTYTLTQAEVGATITVIASYTDNEGSGKSATSAATAAVADNPLPTGDTTTSGDTDGDNINDDTITISFSEPVLVSNVTIANLTLTGIQTFGTGATIAANGESGGYAQSFTITLGADTNLNSGDLITIAAANIVDTAGETAASSFTFTVPDLDAPTIASSNAILVDDADTSGACNTGDIVSIQFSELVRVDNVTLANLSLDSNSLGVATVAAVNAQTIGGVDYALSFTITLGAGATVTDSNTITIAQANVIDVNGNQAQSDISYTLPSLGIPSAAVSNPIVASSSLSNGVNDELTINFSEAVDATKITIANITVNNGHSLGTGATITPSTGTASSFTITLGSDATVTTDDTLTLAAGNVTDVDSNDASADVVFTVPDITPPAAASITSGSASASTAPTIEGTAEVGATIELTFTFGSPAVNYVYTTTATDGTWSVDLGTADDSSPSNPAATLADGDSISYSVTATDANGNRSSVTNRDLAIDTTPPTFVEDTFNADALTLTLTFNEAMQADDGVNLLTAISVTYGDGSALSSSSPSGAVESIVVDPNNAANVIITFNADTDLSSNFIVDVPANTLTNLAGSALADTEVDDYTVTTTAPLVTIASLAVNQGETVTITDSMIDGVDTDTADNLLTFTVASVTNGEFQLSGTASTTFTKADIAAGNVTFVHDGTAAAPTFEIGIDDGTTTIPPSGDNVDITYGEFTTTGLIAYWDAQNIDGSGNANNQPTDGATVTTWNDSSGSANTHNGTGGTATYDADGINGHGALLFDGDDNYDIANHTDINTGTNYTNKSLGIVLQTSTDVDSFQTFYEEGGGVRGYSFVIDDGHIYAGVWNSSEWDSGHRYKSVDLGAVEANTIYTIVVVQDSDNGSDATNTLTIYLNGVEVASTDHVDAQHTHGGAISIGSVENDTVNPRNDAFVSGSNQAYLNGHVGELALWNHSLTGEEVANYANYTFNRWGLTFAPVIDLNGQDTEDFTFSASGQSGDLINIADTDAYIGDPDGAQYNQLSLAVSGLQDGVSEKLAYNGTDYGITDGNTGTLTLLNGTNISYSMSGTSTDVTVVFTTQSGAVLSNDDVDNLLQGLQYTNSLSTAQAGDRSFSFTATDADGLVSDAVASTVTLAGYVYATDATDGALTGTTGADVFDFNVVNTTQSEADVITDFSMAQNDMLDFSDLLTGDTSTLSNYITLGNDGSGNLQLTIDIDGTGGGTDQLVLTLTGVATSTTLATLDDYIIL